MINVIFIVKYASRIHEVNQYLVALFYIAFIAMVVSFIHRYELKPKQYKRLFITILAVFFSLTIYLNVTVDGNALNVDRWSALQVGTRALLSGDYPYSATDHLGGRSSALPFLLIIGIPFYLLGNIGFLQSLCFLIFAYIICRSFNSYRDRLLCLLLLVLSPAYLWEIYVSSDLMSNFIIILLFMAVLHFSKQSDSVATTLAVPFIAASLLLTRLNAFIPLTLLLVNRFHQYPVKKKLLFVAISLLTTVLLLYAGFNQAGSPENFRAYNPFELQNRQLPLALSLALLMLTIAVAYFISNYRSLIWYSALLLLLPVVIAFGITIYHNGINASLFNSSFDISYFNMALPFLLIGTTLTVSSNNPANGATRHITTGTLPGSDNTPITINVQEYKFSIPQ